MPTSKLRARLISMATEHGISVIAVDPAYTSKWGAQYWHKPLAAHRPQTTRHHAASVAIGRRALGHRIRRRVAPPPPHQSDVARHRTTQAESGVPERETTRHPRPGPRTRSPCPPGAKSSACTGDLAGGYSLLAEDSFLHGCVPEGLGFDALAVAERVHIGLLRGFSCCSDFSQCYDDITVGEKALCLYRGGLLR